MLRAKIEGNLVHKLFSPDFTKALCGIRIEGCSSKEVLTALSIPCVGRCIGTLYCLVTRFQSYGFPSWTQQYKVPITKVRNLDEVFCVMEVRNSVVASLGPRSGLRDAVPGDCKSLCFVGGISCEIPLPLARTRGKNGNSDEVLGSCLPKGAFGSCPSGGLLGCFPLESLEA